MASLVSVIIPCYNAERYLDRSIASVYEQDWSSIELIVVDDGSTDHSAEKIHTWEKIFAGRGKNNRLTYIYQENQGLGGAINTGLEYVTGEYLTLLDADDRYLPGSVSERASYLEDHPDCSVVRTNGYMVSGTNKWLFTYDDSEKTGNLFELLMYGKTYNWAGSYMIRTKVLFRFYKERTIYPSRFGQNLQLLIPAAWQNKCAYIDKPLMEYIRDGSSLSNEIDHEKAKCKGLNNAIGYLDIRRHIIEELPLDNEERIKWLRAAEAIYYRRQLQIGMEYKDEKLTREAIDGLKRLEQYTIEDKISYYSYKNKPVSYVYRGIRKIKEHI